MREKMQNGSITCTNAGMAVNCEQLPAEVERENRLHRRGRLFDEPGRRPMQKQNAPRPLCQSREGQDRGVNPGAWLSHLDSLS